MTRKLIIIVALVAVLAGAAVPAFAQANSRTFTITEEQINEAYWVTNPWRRSLSDVSVDLQPDQVVVSATYNRRRAEPVPVTTTLVPFIENGRVFWEATSATKNGEPVSDILLAQINAQINSSWARFWRSQAPTGYVTDVQVTDDALAITFTR
jgi:hypothetical protein